MYPRSFKMETLEMDGGEVHVCHLLNISMRVRE